MVKLRRLILAGPVFLGLLLGGCRAPLAVNRALVSPEHALRDRSLVGIWQWQHHFSQPTVALAFVYPLGQRRYVITWASYKPAVGGGPAALQAKFVPTFVGSLTRLQGRLWLSCQSLDPRLLNSSHPRKWWARHGPFGQPAPYWSALRKAASPELRADGMARIFYLLELKNVSGGRLAIYPLLVPVKTGNQRLFQVPPSILASRRQLRAFLLNARTLAQLLPGKPWLFKRLSAAQARPYLPPN